MKTTPSMTLMDVLEKLSNVQNCSNYAGRARRSEFWYTTLICVVMSLACDCVFYFLEEKWGANKVTGFMDTALGAYFCLTNYSCLCRRMHDINRSCLFPGLTLSFAIVSFVCLIYPKNTVAEVLCIIFTSITALLLIYTLFLCTKDSDKGKNRYGYSDKYVDPNDNPELIDKFWKEYGNDMLKRHSDSSKI